MSAVWKLLLVLVAVLSIEIVVGRLGRRPVGGWRQRSPQDDDIQEAAAFFLQEFLASNNVDHHVRLGNIEEAKSQVVAGMNYLLTLQLEHTGCPSGTQDTSALNCPTTTTQKCTAKLYVVPWRDFRQVHEYKC